ncbi:MAG: hypothetical protein ACR2QF_04755 [Geminicoccaceae bacterium]
MTLKQQIRRFVPNAVVHRYRSYQDWRELPQAARLQVRMDERGALGNDPGSEPVIESCLAWMARAQDCSATADGGVARHFSLIDGWGPSYPETTGYIVPTLLREAVIRDDPELNERARRMLDWLVSIQLLDGGFQGGMITQEPIVPVTFNTGQILIGLAAGTETLGDDAHRMAMHRAATWLVQSQDDDGCWRRHPTPFAKTGEKAYETHVAWGLFEAERVEPGQGYGEAGLRQVNWALTMQQENGWIARCCLDDPARPLTHTLGYLLRGVLEAYRLAEDKTLLRAARKTADPLMNAVGSDGFLAGRFDHHWRPAVTWSCLTGSVQLAYCWFQLFTYTGDARYLEAGRKVNAFVRRTIAVDGSANQIGGVRGSYPISGTYGRYQYLNWAAKFAVDSFRKESELAVQSLIN